MSKWIEKKIGDLIIEKTKSKIQVADATGFGEFPFFTSGDSVLLHNQKLTENENIYLATGGIANVKYYDGEASFSTDTYAISAKSEFDTKFLYYYLSKNIGFINNNYFEGSGLKHLQKNDLKEWRLSLPEDIEEQKRIAGILSKTDELIDATQALIDKQKKIKTGLMQTLLTCGIDDNGTIRTPETHKFKDSELGPIPDEWECVELGKYCKNIVDCPHSSPEYLDYGVFVARTSDIKNGNFLQESCSKVSEQEYQNRISRLEPMAGDVIFTREAPVGESFVVPQNMRICLGQRVMLFRTNKEKLNPYYLVAFLYSNPIQEFFRSINTGLTVQHVNVKDMKALVLLSPSILEQERIVSILQQQDQVIKDLESEKQKYIDIKNGLMSDLLTGKVKVPG